MKINKVGGKMIKRRKNNTPNVRKLYRVKKVELDENHIYTCLIKECVFIVDTIKKIFVVDITKMSDENIKFLFDNFQDFQLKLLADDYFKGEELIKAGAFPYSYSMDLIFSYDQNRDYNINKSEIESDMNFAFKHFLTKDETVTYLAKEHLGQNFNRKKLIKVSGSPLVISSFNYINGNNASGKTRLITDISKSLKAPVYSMDDISLNLESRIKNKENVKRYLYYFTGSSEFDEYSDYQKYMYRLSQILEFSAQQKKPVLLDDLRWNALDNRSQIKLVDGLFQYSNNKESVVLTGCDRTQLIKRRVYKPNIIEL